MSDHLPECRYYPQQSIVGDVGCICKALRACEQRMEASNQGFADMASFELGKREERKRSAVLIADAYAAGLSAARDAVAALEPLLNKGKREGGYDCCGCSSPNDLYDDALAAIDALTDGGCRTPDDPCADPDACDSLTCARERLHLTLRDEADALAAIDALRGEA